VDEAVAYLSRLPLAGLMLVVTLGYLLGRIAIKGVAAGPTAGTVAVALFLGWHGLGIEQLYGGVRPDLTIGRFGFALFIYAVGFEAGPRLVSSLAGRTGWRFVLLHDCGRSVGGAGNCALGRRCRLTGGIAVSRIHISHGLH
jgi:uncharacterized transporter YbjL